MRRIKNEHQDDACAIVNDRVKGSLKVTRAFGAGFLKQVYALIQWSWLPSFMDIFIGKNTHAQMFVRTCSVFAQFINTRDHAFFFFFLLGVLTAFDFDCLSKKCSSLINS